MRVLSWCAPPLCPRCFPFYLPAGELHGAICVLQTPYACIDDPGEEAIQGSPTVGLNVRYLIVEAWRHAPLEHPPDSRPASHGDRPGLLLARLGDDSEAVQLCVPVVANCFWPCCCCLWRPCGQRNGRRKHDLGAHAGRQPARRSRSVHSWSIAARAGEAACALSCGVPRCALLRPPPRIS
jgi:hypothetical protein